MRDTGSRLGAASVGLLLLAMIIGSGCSRSPSGPPATGSEESTNSAAATGSVDEQIAQFLARYDLHAAAQPSVETRLLRDSDSLPDALYFDSSEAIGLDLEPYSNSMVEFHAFTLEERCQSKDGTVTAAFIAKDGRVVGAFMVLSGYIPGPVPLDDRSQFAVEGLSPENLVFEGVTSVEFIGPWTDDDWESRAVLDEAQMRDTLALLADSTGPSDGGPKVDGIAPVEEYAIALDYDGGPEVTARLTRWQGSDVFLLTFDLGTFADCTYVPPPGLLELVKSVLPVE